MGFIETWSFLTGSDSDENSNQNSGSPSKTRPRSPKTPKYNLNLGMYYCLFCIQSFYGCTMVH